MKVVLFLCLITLFACKADILEVAQCLISKPEFKELGLQLINHFSNQDYSKLVPSMLNSLPELFNAVTECLTKKDDDVVLKVSSCEHPVRYAGCVVECLGLKDDCAASCDRKWC